MNPAVKAQPERQDTQPVVNPNTVIEDQIKCFTQTGSGIKKKKILKFLLIQLDKPVQNFLHCIQSCNMYNYDTFTHQNR